MKRHPLPLFAIILAISLTSCKTNTPQDSSSDVSSIAATENIFELQDTSEPGTVTLYDDNSVEIDFEESNVHYVGYITPLEYAQNYHLKAVAPKTNFTNIVESKDDEIYYLDCDILLCDYDQQGNECYIASLFNNLDNTDPTKPIQIKAGRLKSHMYDTYVYFARFITVVDDDGNELYKIAQNYKSDGFLFSGQINIDGKTYSRDDNLFCYVQNAKHVSGSYEPELQFIISDEEQKAVIDKGYVSDIQIEVTLSLVDSDNGIYKQTKIIEVEK